MIENISRHLRMGKERITAAIDATKEISLAVLGSTGVLVFAFVPMLFLPDGAGQYTRSFIVTIIYTVVASLIISLTIIPFLASGLLKRDDDEHGNRGVALADEQDRPLLPSGTSRRHCQRPSARFGGH